MKKLREGNKKKDLKEKLRKRIGDFEIKRFRRGKGQNNDLKKD